MALQRLSLAQLETAILQIMGYASSAVAPWASQANLYLRINEYGQRLPQKLAVAAQQLRAAGERLPYTGPPRFDMWRTVSAASGTSTTTGIQITAPTGTGGYMPIDYDHYISCYDEVGRHPIEPIENVDKYHEYLRTQVTSGTGASPEAFEVLGFGAEGSNWRRKVTFYPCSSSNMTLTYWRIPAVMPGSSASGEYPDIDPKYESIFIYGPAADLARNTGQEFDRYAALEKEMLGEMVMTARGI